MVQAGPKSQLGGLKNGLFKEAYQLGMAGYVKTEPINAGRKQIKIEAIIFLKEILSISNFINKFILI
jgi:hypothetical protein